MSFTKIEPSRTANLDTFFKEESIEIIFDLRMKSMYTFKRIGYF